MRSAALRGYDLFLTLLAWLWRRLNRRTVFVGITGSLGKSTAASCLEAILSSRYTVLRESRNTRRSLARAVLATRSRHDFAIIETGTLGPGAMRTTASMLKPHVALFLNVRAVHADTFGTLGAIQREKAELLKRMAPGGLAVLNAGDPLVMSAPRPSDARVTTFGPDEGSGVWASQVSARWPDRLRLTVHAGGEHVTVQTKLAGEQWVQSVLASVAAALAHGLPLGEIAAALARARPFTARMEPVALPCGAVMIRDDNTGSGPSFDAALEFLRTARAGRRLAVFADMWNPEIAETQARLADMGRRTAAVVEGAVFLGPQAVIAARAAIEAGLAAGAVRAFPGALDAVPYLRSELRAGDLVLLKGQRPAHVARIHYAMLGQVGCRLAACSRPSMCDRCDQLRFVPTAASGFPSAPMAGQA